MRNQKITAVSSSLIYSTRKTSKIIRFSQADRRKSEKIEPKIICVGGISTVSGFHDRELMFNLLGSLFPFFFVQLREVINENAFFFSKTHNTLTLRSKEMKYVNNRNKCCVVQLRDKSNIILTAGLSSLLFATFQKLAILHLIDRDTSYMCLIIHH